MKVVFETATIADAIKKAERIAPGKGQAFDKAAGIVLDVTPGDEAEVVVRATNLDIFSMEWVDAVEIIGEEPVSWRVPSKLFAQLLTKLPIGSGKTVTMEEKRDGRIRMLHVTSGKTRAKFNLMLTEYYPVWDVFDPDELVKADDLGGRIAQVEWAVARSGEPPLNGVHFDGELVLACDQYKLGTAPLPIPGFEEPVTVPGGILGSVLKQTGEVAIGVHEGQLWIMPDEHTQIRAVVYGTPYPKVSKIMRRDYEDRVKVRKAPLIEVLDRAAGFAGNDRFPILRVFFGKGEIAAMMNTAEIGALADVLEVPGQCGHDRFEVKFTPKNLLDALNACPNDELEIGYDKTNSMRILYIDGGSGYEAWVMPRKDLSPQEKAENEEARSDAA